MIRTLSRATPPNTAREAVALALFCGTAMAAPAQAAATLTTLAAFAAPAPGHPLNGMVAGTDGAFYGTEFGTISFVYPPPPPVPFPAIFQLTHNAKGKPGWQTTLIAAGTPATLGTPAPSFGNPYLLTPGPGGVLYAAASINGCLPPVFGVGWPCAGVVLFTPPPTGQSTWGVSEIARFPNNGLSLQALTRDPSGALIGLGGGGTIFRLTPPAPGQTAWTPQTLWQFTGGADGAFPTAPLLIDATGAVYGATVSGGAAGCPSTKFTTGCGTVFQLTPPPPPAKPAKPPGPKPPSIAAPPARCCYRCC